LEEQVRLKLEKSRIESLMPYVLLERLFHKVLYQEEDQLSYMPQKVLILMQAILNLLKEKLQVLELSKMLSESHQLLSLKMQATKEI
jgi:hypothetical protein